MNTNETIISGKEQAKINKRKSFYSKFERQIKSFQPENLEKTFFLINFQNKTSFPTFDDLTILLKDFSEEIESFEADTQNLPISMQYIEEGMYLKALASENIIKILKKETFENDDGTIRKGSNGAIDDYNYQSAYNFYIQIVQIEKILTSLAKEKESPSLYEIVVKTKKIEQKKYYKTYRYPRKGR